jgi:hypothetical protein
MSESNSTRRHRAAEVTFEDILGDLRRPDPGFTKATSVGEDSMDGLHLATLLEKNFSRLDPDNNGITREEIAHALLAPWSWSADEFCMLKLLGKYFDTIIHMSDDEAGPETRITLMDKDVLCQFLTYGGLSLAQLQAWRSLDTSPDT